MASPVEIEQPVTASALKMASPVSERIRKIAAIRMIESRAHRKSIGESLPDIETEVGVGAQLDEPSLRIVVHVEFTLRGLYASKASPAEEALRIEARFELIYGVSSTVGLTTDSVDAFGKTNGVFNVWPYWREYVQSSVWRMGLPSLLIPPLQLTGNPAGGEATQSDPRASTE